MNKPPPPSPSPPKQFGLKRLFLRVAAVAVICALIGGLYRFTGDAGAVTAVLAIASFLMAPLLVVLIALLIPAPTVWVKYVCDVILAALCVGVVIVAASSLSLKDTLYSLMFVFVIWSPQFAIYFHWRKSTNR